MSPPRRLLIAPLTVASLVAFAGNSLLCRQALATDAIDPASFTSVRLISAALALQLLLWIRALVASSDKEAATATHGSWRAAAALFGYAICFSFAYVAQPAGTGALLLFGAVQTTMIVFALLEGEHLSFLQWVGLAVAIGGILVLVAPGIGMPSPISALVMIVAGACWAAYTLLGRGERDPLGSTASNFVRTLPLTVAASLLALALGQGSPSSISTEGVVLASISGAITSGLGYTLWYAALPGLTVTRAATVQLSVPVIAALGGVWLLDETVTGRLVLASLTILGGIGLTLAERPRR